MGQLRLALAVVVLGLAGCKTTDGAGDYWCVTGAKNAFVGACTVDEAGCRSKAIADGAAGRCEQRHTLLQMLRWNGKYGPMEIFYVDSAACEQARLTWKVDAPCEPAPADGPGQHAH
jgi:hypothetical protein